MVRGLTVNQVYDVKVYGRSSRPCRANKNVMLVVQWWWNHLKKLAAYRGVWSTPSVLGTENPWFESRYAEKLKCLIVTGT